jgi:hypothetical protein
MSSLASDPSAAVYDVLEATVKAAIQFTRADAGHIFLIKRRGDQTLVSHQCLIPESGAMIRQYQADRPERFGPCSRAIRDGKMYYVHDCASNTLHQRLLEDLRRLWRQSEPDSLKRQYLKEYVGFLARAKSYIAVPIRTLEGHAIGCIGLYSYAREDDFGTMEKRIIEEYMNNFASSLILALLDKARHDNARMQDVLTDSGGEPVVDPDFVPSDIFDTGDASEFHGLGLVLESVFRQKTEFDSWNDLIGEIERVLISFALKRTNGRSGRACRLLRMPKRTFYHKVKRFGMKTPRAVL